MPAASKWCRQSFAERGSVSRPGRKRDRDSSGRLLGRLATPVSSMTRRRNISILTARSERWPPRGATSPERRLFLVRSADRLRHNVAQSGWMFRARFVRSELSRRHVRGRPHLCSSGPRGLFLPTVWAVGRDRRFYSSGAPEPASPDEGRSHAGGDAGGDDGPHL